MRGVAGTYVARMGTHAVGFRWGRAAGLLLLGWWTLSLAGRPERGCWLDLVDLAFHEAGHLFFRPFGTTLTYLGGTLGQLLVPAGLALWFVWRERRPGAAAFCCWWVGQNLANVSVYMADARELALPLVGGGDHDWNELFYRFGLLGETSVQRVAGSTHAAGVVVLLAGLVWCGYFVLRPAVQQRVRARMTTRWPWAELLLG